MQKRDYTIERNSIQADGLTFTIDPDLDTEAPTRISLSFIPMDEPNGADNALYPVLFMTDHFGTNCKPAELIKKSIAELRNHGEYCETIGDWTFKLMRDGDRFLLQVS